MSDTNFLTYKKFLDKSDATVLCDLLTKNSIEFIIEDTSASFDPSFANNNLTKEYRIKLQKSDFEKADKIQIETFESQLGTVSKDHYLFDFSDQELVEILTKRDEWSTFDYLLAQKILAERGNPVSKELLDALRKQRIEELGKPEDSQKTWIIAGYSLALLGGIIGTFIGWHLRSHRKTLPNGDSVYGYSPHDRKHGARILILGIVFFIMWTVIKVMTAE